MLMINETSLFGIDALLFQKGAAVAHGIPGNEHGPYFGGTRGQALGGIEGWGGHVGVGTTVCRSPCEAETGYQSLEVHGGGRM